MLIKYDKYQLLYESFNKEEFLKASIEDKYALFKSNIEECKDFLKLYVLDNYGVNISTIGNDTPNFIYKSIFYPNYIKTVKDIYKSDMDYITYNFNETNDINTFSTAYKYFNNILKDGVKENTQSSIILFLCVLFNMQQTKEQNILKHKYYNQYFIVNVLTEYDDRFFVDVDFDDILTFPLDTLFENDESINIYKKHKRDILKTNLKDFYLKSDDNTKEELNVLYSDLFNRIGVINVMVDKDKMIIRYCNQIHPKTLKYHWTNNKSVLFKSGSFITYRTFYYKKIEFILPDINKISDKMISYIIYDIDRNNANITLIDNTFNDKNIKNSISNLNPTLVDAILKKMNNTKLNYGILKK